MMTNDVPSKNLSENLDNMKRQFAPYLILIALSLSACSEPPPPIGSGLPRNLDEAAVVFDKRVKTMFPVGSDESSLRAELTHQGFEIGAVEHSSVGRLGKFSAERQANEVPWCRTTWFISWNAEAGKIVDIEGHYDVACL